MHPNDLIDQSISDVLNSFEDYVFLMNKAGMIVFANNAAVRKLGYPHEEFLNLNVLELHPVNQRGRAGIIVENMLRGTENVCPIPLVAKSGELIPVETKVSTLMLNGEQFIFGISRDITAWLKANSRLMESEEKFRRSFDLSTRLLAISDFETGEYIDINELFSKTTGFSRDEVLGESSVNLKIFEFSQRESLVEKLRRNEQVKDEEVEVYLERKGKSILCLFDAVVFESNNRKYLMSSAVDITGRKADALALESSERRLNQVLEGANDGFWDWNFQTGEVEFSKRWAAMIGYDLNEFEHTVKFWEDLVHPDDRAYVFAELENHLQGKTERYETEHRVKCKDGSWLWILDRGKIVERDATGKILRMAGTHSDIHEKKLAEEKLLFRESFEQFVNEIATTLINIPFTGIDRQIDILLSKLGDFIGVDRVYIFLLDPIGILMTNTHEWCRENISPQKENLKDVPVSMFPWWMEKISANQIINIEDVDNMPEEASSERELIKAQEIKSLIVLPLINQRIVRGFVGFDAVTASRKWDSDIELLLRNAAITIVNALQRKEDESAIDKYKNHLEELIRERTQDLKVLWEAAEHSANGIVITDSNFRILYVNNQYIKTCGYDSRELLGHSSKIVRSYKHSADFYEQMDETLKSGKIWKGRIINKRKDGTLYTEDNVVSPVRGAGDQIVNFIGITRDITQELRREQEIQQSEKLRALGTLAGGIAHDFNNILQIVQVYTELIEFQEKNNPTISDNIKEIIKACLRGKSLINNILTFSRLEPNEMALYSFDFLVKEIVNMARPIYPSSVDITTAIEPTGLVLCDPVQVQQIIFNLFNNSVDAMNGKGTIRVELKKITSVEKNSQNNIQLKIIDNGKGMTKTVLDRVFDPFYTTKSVGEGTGLGLSTVLGIVKRHNAIIKIVSEPGKGTETEILFLSNNNKQVNI